VCCIAASLEGILSLNLLLAVNISNWVANIDIFLAISKLFMIYFQNPDDITVNMPLIAYANVPP